MCCTSLLRRIEEHVAHNSLIDFPIILHGGEPYCGELKIFSKSPRLCKP